jgi:hypothetical protein
MQGTFYSPFLLAPITSSEHSFLSTQYNPAKIRFTFEDGITYILWKPPRIYMSVSLEHPVLFRITLPLQNPYQSSRRHPQTMTLLSAMEDGASCHVLNGNSLDRSHEGTDSNGASVNGKQVTEAGSQVPMISHIYVFQTTM